MKKVLSNGAFLLVLFNTINAQTLQNDNFNSYTIGNVGTDITATTPGQGGFYTDFAGGSNSEAQIVNIDASHDKSLQLTGNATATGTKYMWKNGLAAAWAARTPGNNIIKLNVSLYTGSATDGVGRGTVMIYNTTTHKTLVGIGYNYATKKIMGIAHYTDNTGQTANFGLNLGTNIYPANTWIPLSCTFDKTTGMATWTTPEGSFSPGPGYTPAAVGEDPFEMDFVSAVGTGNTVAHITSFDDYVLMATNTAVLGTKEAVAEENSVSVYPSPAIDFINIHSKSQITKIEIFDTAGRKINAKLDNDKVEVRKLNPGAYIIIIETKGDRFSKKFIKK
ncbi:T9SS type A sorting domain-containing protein [Chryseobacterium populi]|uniref:Por secretion system C-terminal sorting domain containing protein n=1 Tax=Chryseobacterium populi TaxID=1144316 RepID=J2JRQ6_9FLAO|nr:T9SS type A sorting domain-containing protein [Chryseobacterium populi]EJL70495.1 Por secretion system C-terminal sorting domain containing protein [Chryseobacterium populi]